MRSETLDELLDSAVRRLPLPCDPQPAEQLPGQQRQQQTAVRLRDGGVWSTCSAKAGIRVRCAAGTLWLTHPAAPRDVILRPGESFVARPGTGKVVVQALDDATFWVE
jgi:hypothetical protein